MWSDRRRSVTQPSWPATTNFLYTHTRTRTHSHSHTLERTFYVLYYLFTSLFSGFCCRLPLVLKVAFVFCFILYFAETQLTDGCTCEWLLFDFLSLVLVLVLFLSLSPSQNNWYVLPRPQGECCANVVISQEERIHTRKPAGFVGDDGSRG